MIINREKIMSSAAELTADITTTAAAAGMKVIVEPWVLQNMGEAVLLYQQFGEECIRACSNEPGWEPPEGYYRD